MQCGHVVGIDDSKTVLIFHSFRSFDNTDMAMYIFSKHPLLASAQVEMRDLLLSALFIRMSVNVDESKIKEKRLG